MVEPLSTDMIEKAKRGDPRAIEELVARFQKPLFYYAVHYTGNPSEAEDITQEVLFKIIRALPSFKGQASISTWMYRIMTNACIDFKRKKVLSKTVSFNSGMDEEAFVYDPADTQPLPDEQYEKLELHDWLRRALQQLSPEHRTTIILHDLHGFKYQEIAEITGSSLGTVKSRLFYARQMLRKILEPSINRGDF